MRNYRYVALIGLLLFITGCPSTPFGFLQKNEPGPPQSVPPIPKMVAYLNDNSNRIQSVRYEDITLSVSQGGQSGNLRAMMMVQKPRNFRMSADAYGPEMVDLGSNDQEFWWWIADASKKKSSQPGIGEQMYCSYDDLRQGRAQRWKIPLEPEWVIEVLGMGNYVAERYKQEVHPETVDLVEKTRMNGRDVRKVIVFQRRARPLPYPLVSDYKLIDDATGKVICSAHISEIHQDKIATGAYLPRKIEIVCPEMNNAKLVMKMDYLFVNPGMVNPITRAPNKGEPVPMTAFVRRPIAGTISRNLADSSNEVLRVQGEFRK